MKKTIIRTCAVVSIAGMLFAGGSLDRVQSGITGKVNPADGANSVWAIGGKDTVKGTINTGAFSLSVKTGTYRLLIDAKDPYKDVVLENLEVKDQPLDVGEIILQ